MKRVLSFNLWLQNEEKERAMQAAKIATQNW
jgi:hypothetical protein